MQGLSETRTPPPGGLSERCSLCGNSFTVQFSYQMEEREAGFVFYCTQECQGRALSGESTGGVPCGACNKMFVVELVSQVVRTRAGRAYACSDGCRDQIQLEAGGMSLRAAAKDAFVSTPLPPSVAVSPAPQASAVAPTVPSTVDAAAHLHEPAVQAVGRELEGKRPLSGPTKLAIFNHKGGTGKTTTSVSIAAGLASRGYKVLLVDTDSQGNVGVSLDIKAKLNLYHVLVMGLNIRDAVVNVRPNLDVLVSNETLAAAELYLAGRQNRDRVLRDRLLKASEGYDIVIVDCSPSLSLLNQNALVFADGILVPVACDFLSIVGVRQVVKTVKNVNSLLHHPVKIYGVLPTFYDARAKIAREALDTLHEHFGDRCFAPIRAATKIKEAPAQGKTIFEYAPDSNAADDYLAVVERIISGEHKTSGEFDGNHGGSEHATGDAGWMRDREIAAAG